MSRHTRRALTLLAALPAAAAAQQPRALPAAEASWDEPFSLVSGVRELSNGRLVVADGRDKLLQLVDLKAGSATKIGREGSGPGEFNLPFRLFALAADTTLLFDPGNSRYLIIGPDGKPGKDFRIETPAPAGRAGAAGGPVRIGVSMARAADARGRLYYETPGISIGPDNRPVPADSAAILRWDRATQRTDTMAWVKLPKNNVQTSGGQGNFNVRIGGSNPLQARDEWTVFPDGRLAIARANPYRVEFIATNGTRTTGPALPHTPIRITDADKKEEEATQRALANTGLRMMVTEGPNGRQMSASIGGGRGQTPDLPPITDWPETKPPFRQGLASVWARPNGELWVRRTERAGAKGALYDVIDAKGAVKNQVRVPDGLTLVGFGSGTAYTTKADEDDLLTLQRHRVP